jgi:hypothetical protein
MKEVIANESRGLLRRLLLMPHREPLRVLVLCTGNSARRAYELLRQRIVLMLELPA